jgi:uncharacterized protein YdiU (UPF0061 family)
MDSRTQKELNVMIKDSENLVPFIIGMRVFNELKNPDPNNDNDLNNFMDIMDKVKTNRKDNPFTSLFFETSSEKVTESNLNKKITNYNNNNPTQITTLQEKYTEIIEKNEKSESAKMKKRIPDEIITLDYLKNVINVIEEENKVQKLTRQVEKETAEIRKITAKTGGGRRKTRKSKRSTRKRSTRKRSKSKKKRLRKKRKTKKRRNHKFRKI